MEMTGVSSLLPNLRRVITGPLDVSMEEALLDACATLCRQSELIVLSRTVASWDESDEIEVSDIAELQSCQILRVINPESGTPYKAGTDYHASSPNELTALTNLNGAELWYAAEPKRESRLIPKMTGEHYGAAISSGAAAILYLQPDRPWTDPRRAAEHQARFVEGIRHAGRFRKNHAAPEHVEFSNPRRRRSFF